MIEKILLMTGGMERERRSIGRGLCWYCSQWSLCWWSTWCPMQWQTLSTQNSGSSKHVLSTSDNLVISEEKYLNVWVLVSVDICKNLTAHDDLNNKVQSQVNDWLLYSRYMEIPQSIVSLYLGPISDKGRKPLMLVPFLGHVISGTLMILNVYFEQWDARLLWLSNTYILFGGYTLLQIAM